MTSLFVLLQPGLDFKDNEVLMIPMVEGDVGRKAFALNEGVAEMQLSMSVLEMVGPHWLP